MQFRILSVGVGLFFTAASATLPQYLWRHAPLGFQTVNGVSVQVTERLNLNGWRGDWYQQKPLNLGGSVSWVSWSMHPAFTYAILKEGPLGLTVGGAWDVVLKRDFYSESRPNLQFNLSGELGPISLETQNVFEKRNIQLKQSDPTKKEKYVHYRWLPRVKVSLADGFSNLKLSPYIFWEGSFEKKQSPLYLMDNSDLKDSTFSAFHAIEFGTMSRLTKEIGLGIADQFMFIPTHKQTGYNRITTYLTWYFDTVNP